MSQRKTMRDAYIRAVLVDRSSRSKFPGSCVLYGYSSPSRLSIIENRAANRCPIQESMFDPSLAYLRFLVAVVAVGHTVERSGCPDTCYGSCRHNQHCSSKHPCNSYCSGVAFEKEDASATVEVAAVGSAAVDRTASDVAIAGVEVVATYLQPDNCKKVSVGDCPWQTCPLLGSFD